MRNNSGAVVALSLGFVLMLGAYAKGGQEQTPLASVPEFNENGELIIPDDIDEWVFLGTMLGPQYAAGEFNPDAPGLFHTALMEPTAYRAFLESGEFADGTMFALIFRQALDRMSIHESGFVMGELMQTEIHLKDSERFPDGYNFYVYAPGADVARALPTPNGCIECHSAHGAYDGVFAQFYPILRDKIPPEALERALDATAQDLE
ncbi:MAG: hypothetical protein Tsb0010_19540 [Parvularculaceae bacterium]